MSKKKLKKQQQLYIQLLLVYNKHFRKINIFLQELLREYIFTCCYKEVIKQIHTDKSSSSLFNSLITLYIKKLNFLKKFNFFFSEYLNSFCFFHNLPFYNKNVFLYQQLNLLDLKKKTHFLFLFFSKYFKNIFISKDIKSINLYNSIFFIFLLKYLKKRFSLVVYLNSLIEYFSIINIVYADILKLALLKNKIKAPEFISLQLPFREYYNHFFLEKRITFDLLEFNTNYVDRKKYTFDMSPFLLCFFRNFNKIALFHHFSRLFLF